MATIKHIVCICCLVFGIWN